MKKMNKIDYQKFNKCNKPQAIIVVLIMAKILQQI